MTSMEKAELLKKTIYQLYSKEGRSKSYISRLLDINRKTITRKIREWKLPEPKPMRHVKPSTRKYIAKHKQKILSLLAQDVSLKEISEQTGVSGDKLLKTFFVVDNVLGDAYKCWNKRRAQKHEDIIMDSMRSSSRNYEYEKIDGEKWKSVLGYDGYEVSTKGRVRKYSKKCKSYYLLKPYLNQTTGRYYVSLASSNGKVKNLLLHRVVAQSFIPHEDYMNTVNHKDGDPQNNEVENLEWVTQSQNNKHAYRCLHRSKVRKKRYVFDYILYKNKYRFKTVASFAKFIGKSETQTRRYIDNKERYDVKLICNCID